MYYCDHRRMESDEYGYLDKDERDDDDDFLDDEEREREDTERDGMVDRQKGRRLISGCSTV